MVDKKAKRFKYIYGPVPSWRLGSSLGVDLLSGNEKVCAFDCLYCQIGPAPIKTKKRQVYVPTGKVVEEIKKLPADLDIDYITFSGMGEPTLAENLGEAIKAVKTLKRGKVAVITNSALMWEESVRNELALSDFIMAKLDAADRESFDRINKPANGITFKDVYEGIKSFRKEHNTRLAVQIMFFEANRDEFKGLAELAFEVDPDEIQINTPLRPCGVNPLSEADIAKIKKYFEDFGKKIDSKTKITAVFDKGAKKLKPISREDTLKRRGKIE